MASPRDTGQNFGEASTSTRGREMKHESQSDTNPYFTDPFDPVDRDLALAHAQARAYSIGSMESNSTSRGGRQMMPEAGPSQPRPRDRSSTSTTLGMRRRQSQGRPSASAHLDNWQALGDMMEEGENDTEDAQKAIPRYKGRGSLSSVFLRNTGTESVASERGRASSGYARASSLRGYRTGVNERRTSAQPIYKGSKDPPSLGVTTPPVVLSSSPPLIDPPASPSDEAFRENGHDGRAGIQDDSEVDEHSHRATTDPADLKEEVGDSRGRASNTFFAWPPPPAAIAVFKCSVAYLIGSLFTFNPFLNSLILDPTETDAHGRRQSSMQGGVAYMVATIVVYFNPAKTLGNMTLSLRFAILLLIGATTVCVLSMGTLAFFDHFSPSQGTKFDWVSEAGDWVVCLLFIGGSMGALAGLRVYVGNPSFNSGCNMASMLVWNVVIKEGAFPRLFQIAQIVLIGCAISTFSCILIFPSSATTRLQGSVGKSVSSFSTLLDLLTSTFMLEKVVLKPGRIPLNEAVQSHAKTLKTLKTDLAEAKHERLYDSRIRGRQLKLYDAAIGSLARLAQHLAGLRSSTKLQEGLIRAIKEGRVNADLSVEKGDVSTFSFRETSPGPTPPVVEDEEIVSAVKLFLQFRDIAGNELSDLVGRCDEALDAVQNLSRASSSDHGDHSHLGVSRDQLSSALDQFHATSGRAIRRLYAGPRREKEYSPGNLESHQDQKLNGGLPEPEGPNETVFLIYFFLFTLEEFARELLFLLDTVADILSSKRVTAWEDAKPAISGDPRKVSGTHSYAQYQHVTPIDPSTLQPPLFPATHRASQGSLHIPPRQQLSKWARLRQTFWRLGERLSRPDAKYVIKVTIAGALLASPAFTEWGRPSFLEYRGEWALIAFFATMSPTVGQTNFLSAFRVVGTIIGATTAVLYYKLFPDNPIILPILGYFTSLPAFYVITQMPEYTQAARFTLLAYNLTCLSAYDSRDNNLEVTTIAFQRSSTVIIGTLWSTFVSHYWWPFTARRELRMGISDFCLDLSYLYSKLVSSYSGGSGSRRESMGKDDRFQSETSPLLATAEPGTRHDIKQFMAMELHLQGQLQSLTDLIKHTKNEPRFKGPFAFAFYKEVLLSCERMLDRLHSIRCVTMRHEWDEEMRRAFVMPVNRHRREMAGNVILYLYTISAGFRLRTPMPPYLPPAEEARDKLVQAIRSLDIVRSRSDRGDDGRHLLFFAHALAMQEVIAELVYLGTMMQDAFGVISQSTVVDFVALFPSDPAGSFDQEGRRSI